MSTEVTIALAGDVMTGRGIDQILRCPSAPQLFEPHVRDARDYVQLAERVNGPVPHGVDAAYVWGEALPELHRPGVRLRIVNLETAITASEDAWPGKGIHYRMHPANVACLGAAGIDCCTLANNHVLDWGRAGLEETLQTLQAAGLRSAGAGRNADAAWAPAALPLDAERRVLVFSCATSSSGVPAGWAAGPDRSGVALQGDLSVASARRLADHVTRQRRRNDVVIVSIHWGGNWGVEVPTEHRAFAHRLIDLGTADIVHGHSSHHPMPIEVYRDRLILYGCGDYLTDYEGIGGYASFRPDLALAYLPTIEVATGRLLHLMLAPMRIRHLRVTRARGEEARWLARTLSRESAPLGLTVVPDADDCLTIAWR